MTTSPRSTGTATSRVLSPTSLASSFSMISPPTRHADDAGVSSDESFASLSEDSSDDDEIVWSVSDLSASFVSSQRGPLSPELFSDDDFIVLGQPHAASPRAASSAAPSSAADGLSDGLADLTVEDTDTDSDASSVRPTSQASSRPHRRRQRRGPHSGSQAPAPSSSGTPAQGAAQPPIAPATPKRRNRKPASPASAPAGSPKSPSKKALKKRAKKAKAQAQASAGPGLGARPIVDDVSEAGDAKGLSLYEDAVQYISSFLSLPSEESKKKSDLTFLQALIVELGLCSPASSSGHEQSFYHLQSLPRSIRAAKDLLKSNVFLNVRDYLDQRNKGLDALRSVMHPSRKALVKDLSRGKGQRKVPRDVVKSTGLGVLLVTCYS